MNGTDVTNTKASATLVTMHITTNLYIIFTFHHLLTYWFCKPSYNTSTWIVRNKREIELGICYLSLLTRRKVKPTKPQHLQQSKQPCIDVYCTKSRYLRKNYKQYRPSLHFPECLNLTSVPFLQTKYIRIHSVLYVTPSVPHTGLYILGQALAQEQVYFPLTFTQLP